MRRRLLLLSACIPFFAAPASAQDRVVFVNGLRMTDRQVAQLETFACTAIPDGAYWLNLTNGAWGYVGDWSVQGFFGDQCNAAARRERKSLSERGMLYSPGEILRGSP